MKEDFDYTEISFEFQCPKCKTFTLVKWPPDKPANGIFIKDQDLTDEDVKEFERTLRKESQHDDR